MNRGSISVGTLGGVLFGIYPSVLLGDIFRTILMALIGAIVSFSVSLLLNILIKKRR